MPVLRVALSIFLSLLVVGCAQPQKLESCQEADWFELGRREGAQGLNYKYLNANIPLVCQQSDPVLYKKLYLSGYNQGLVEFCRPEIAFELGRSGRDYNPICPSDYQATFFDFYQRGKRFLELEATNIELNKRISQLSQKIQGEPLSKTQKQVHNELDKLQKLKAENDGLMRSLEITL